MKQLHFYSIDGARLAVPYEVENANGPTAEEIRTLINESKIHTASIKFPNFGNLKKKLNEGDVLWFDGDSGSIRKLIVEDTLVTVIYSANVRDIHSKIGNHVLSLMPTLFEWLQAQPLLSTGLGMIVTLGGLAFATMKWWPKSKIEED